MGFPYHELVPPAILLNNPGVTAQEYVKLLDATKANCFRQHNPNDPWDLEGIGIHLVQEHHKGIDGLANVLFLKESEAYKKFRKNRVDSRGIILEGSFMLPLDESDGLFPEYKFELIFHEKNNLGKKHKRKDEFSFSKLSVGSIWSPPMGGGLYLVTAIEREEKLVNETREIDDEDRITYKYDLEARPIVRKERRVVFKSEEELQEHFPVFNPSNRYAWSNKGAFGETKSFLNTGNFLWKRKDEKYYLDPETFDRIPTGFTDTREFGYHDLVLTAEAIKQGAWKLLSYKGIIHMHQFLRDFPSSRKIYEKAVFDAQTSLYFAKPRKMTHNEFLRSRFLPRELIE